MIWDRSGLLLVQKMLTIKDLTDVHLLSDLVLLLILIAQHSPYHLKACSSVKVTVL